jgi:hypothetical protein
MKITVRAVKDLARNAGFTEETIERNIDTLINLTFGIAHRERKYCRAQLRKWIHSDEIAKPHLLDVLKEPEEDEHLNNV